MQENEKDLVEAQTQDDTNDNVTQEPESWTQPQPQKPDPQQSFAQLRERSKKIELANLELARELEQYKAQAQAKREIADDDVVMGSDVKELKNEITNLRREHKKLSADQMLRQQYPDIETVVSAKNIENLRENHPMIAASLSANQDYYSQAAAAYEIIKKLGINEDAYAKEKEIVQANSAKPRPLSSLKTQESVNPLDRANAFQNGLTKELKDQLLKEMNDAIRQGY